MPGGTLALYGPKAGVKTVSILQQRFYRIWARTDDSCLGYKVILRV